MTASAHAHCTAHRWFAPGCAACMRARLAVDREQLLDAERIANAKTCEHPEGHHSGHLTRSASGVLGVVLACDDCGDVLRTLPRRLLHSAPAFTPLSGAALDELLALSNGR